MLIVYNGRFGAVEVPDVGGVVLRRGEPKDIADTAKSRALLKRPEFELVVEEAKPEPEPVGDDEPEPAPTSRKRKSAKVDNAEVKEDE